MEYMQAIKRPFSDFSKLSIGFSFLFFPGLILLLINTGFQNVLSATTLNATSILLLVLIAIISLIDGISNLIVSGYQVECGRTILKKKYKLPDWTSLWHLFINGALATVIGIIYLIPFLIFLVITMGNVLIEMIKNPTVVSDQLILNSIDSFTIPGLIITLLLLVLGIYLIPIAIMSFISKNRFKEAFNIPVVFKKAFKWKYLLAILIILLYSAIILIASTIITYVFSLFSSLIILTIINDILSALTNFLIAVTAITLVGEIYPKL
ncbi:MAG: DUF4013 domain-containing protein [archaeon]